MRQEKQAVQGPLKMHVEDSQELKKRFSPSATLRVNRKQGDRAGRRGCRAEGWKQGNAPAVQDTAEPGHLVSATVVQGDRAEREGRTDDLL